MTAGSCHKRGNEREGRTSARKRQQPQQPRARSLGLRLLFLCRARGHEQVVQTFKAETVRRPQREVVDPNEPLDAKAGMSVVPRDVADEPTEKPAARVLDTDDAGAVERGAERDRTLSEPVMHRLEEQFREPIDGHIQEAARAAPAGAGEDEERVNRPAGEAVGEEARAPGEARFHSRQGQLFSTRRHSVDPNET